MSSCADCGIPEVWWRRVSSNPAHCWRWDYERFDTIATERAAFEAALRSIATVPATSKSDLDLLTVRDIAHAALTRDA